LSIDKHSPPFVCLLHRFLFPTCLVIYKSLLHPTSATVRRLEKGRGHKVIVTPLEPFFFFRIIKRTLNFLFPTNTHEMVNEPHINVKTKVSEGLSTKP